jgi:hypothetical protein
MPDPTPEGPHGAAQLLARDPDLRAAERKTVIAGLTALQTILAAAGSAIAAAIGWYAHALRGGRGPDGGARRAGAG